MTKEIIQEIAESLLSQNDWLSEIRTIGYLSKPSGDRLVVIDGKDEIGITDRSGNSGYIRFRSDTNFRVTKIPSFSSCFQSSRYTYDLRLIVVVKTEAPENIALLLSTQLNAIRPITGTQTKCEVQSGGSNSLAIVKTEGGEQWNNNYRAMYIDFTMSFDWRDDCQLIETDMSCTNCTNTQDLGCVPHCDEVTIPVDVPSGEYTLLTIFNGTSVIQKFDFTDEDPSGYLTVPMSGLNESYQYDIQIKNSDGEVIEWTIDETTYNCFRIQLLP